MKFLPYLIMILCISISNLCFFVSVSKNINKDICILALLLNVIVTGVSIYLIIYYLMYIYPNIHIV